MPAWIKDALWACLGLAVMCLSIRQGDIWNTAGGGFALGIFLHAASVSIARPVGAK